MISLSVQVFSVPHKLGLALAVAAIALASGGCDSAGGEAGGEIEPPAPTAPLGPLTAGRVEMPEGSGVRVENLTVVSLTEEAEVEPDGNVEVSVYDGDGLQIVAATTGGASGDVALLGVADPEAGVVEVSARSTALALSLMSPYLLSAPTDERRAFAEAVERQPAFEEAVIGIEEEVRRSRGRLDLTGDELLFESLVEAGRAAMEDLSASASAGRLSAEARNNLPSIEQGNQENVEVVNPTFVAYGATAYAEGVTSSAATVADARREVVDWVWAFPPRVEFPGPVRTEFPIGDGYFRIEIEKGTRFTTCENPRGATEQATCRNIGFCVGYLVEALVGIGVDGLIGDLSGGGITISPGRVLDISTAVREGDTFGVVSATGGIVLDNRDLISLRLAQGATAATAARLLAATTGYGVVVSNVWAALGAGNGTLPFIRDWVFAPASVTAYVTQRNGTITGRDPQAPQGLVSGSVRSAGTLAPLPDVNVTLRSSAGASLATSRSDAGGLFELETDEGGPYRVEFDAPGYLPARYRGVRVMAGEATVLEPVLQVDATAAGRGSVEGVVRSAVDLRPVGGASLQLREDYGSSTGAVVATATTAADGSYRFAELAPGYYTAEVSAAGFSTSYISVVSRGGGSVTTDQNVSLAPALSRGETRVVLTWGAEPRDLDSHLTGPDERGSRFHVYFGNRRDGGSFLDVDDTSSFGPETITIEAQRDGLYRYSVHDFSNGSSDTSRELSDSGARVEVYQAQGLVAAFNVPPGRPGTLWTVFELEGSSLRAVNALSFADRSSQIPFGPDHKQRLSASQ